MRVIVGVLSALLLTTNSFAQNSGIQNTGLERHEGVARIGLTIPFGQGRKKEPSRVELLVSRDVVQWDGSRQLRDAGEVNEFRVGFWLNQGNTLLVNGNPMVVEQRNGVSTLGVVAIGVGLTIIVGGALLYADVQDASE